MAGALLLLLLLVVAVWLWRKEAREAKRLGAKLYTAAFHLLGIPGLEPKKIVRLFFADDRLIIRSGKQTFELNYDKVTAIKAARKTDLIQKNKSVIGRGVVGGVAFGGVGAIVGALSAVGGKKATKGNLLIVYYKPDGQDEPQPMAFDLRKTSRPARFEKFVLSQRPELAAQDYIAL